MEPHSQKYDLLKGKNYNLRNFSYNFFPIEALEQCIRNSHENAATKIQSAWRGYCCRKLYRENKTKMKENNAALVIQRSVREWLHKKTTEESTKFGERTIYLERLDESKIPQLQEEIKTWNETNKAHFESPEKLQSQLGEVQEELKKFYERASTRKAREQRCEAIYTQIEAIANVLSDLPSLIQCEHSDVSMFRTPVVADAKIAKLRHKQQLKAYSAPWWKRLNMQNENFM